MASVALWAFALPALAEDQDAIALINERLSKLKNYRLADRCYPVVVGQHWIQLRPPRGDFPAMGMDVNVMGTKCDPPQVGKLQTTSLHYESLVFDKTEIVVNSLPNSVYGESVVSINCSHKDQETSVDYEFGRRHSITQTTTHGITNTIEANTKVTFKYAKTVGGEFGLRDSYQVSNTTSSSIVEETTEREKRTFPVQISAMTNFVHQAWVGLSTDRLSWHATVLVDGPVIANKDNINQVSDVLPAVERTLELAGYIDNVNSTHINPDYVDTPLTDAQCRDFIAKGLAPPYRVNYLLYPPPPLQSSH